MTIFGMTIFNTVPEKENKQKPGRPKKIEKAQINQKDISDYFIKEN